VLNPADEPWPMARERALRWAALLHQGQVRRGSGVPYIEHPMAVAAILDRLGFGEVAVIAGLLHDAVEDTGVTLGEVRDRFGPEVAAIVDSCSEVKLDAEGQKRPWGDRKRDHLAALATAPTLALAVFLADKLHNLISIRLDLDEGHAVWPDFHASRDRVLEYYRAALGVAGMGDPRLEALAAACRRELEVVETSPEKNPGDGTQEG